MTRVTQSTHHHSDFVGSPVPSSQLAPEAQTPEPRANNGEIDEVDARDKDYVCSQRSLQPFRYCNSESRDDKRDRDSLVHENHTGDQAEDGVICVRGSSPADEPLFLPDSQTSEICTIGQLDSIRAAMEQPGLFDQTAKRTLVISTIAILYAMNEADVYDALNQADC